MRLKFIRIVVLLLGSAAWAQAKFPQGWRAPKDTELGVPRNELSAAADFDGDGKPDQAAILVDDAGRTAGLFVFLSSSSRWTKLESGKLPEWRGLHVIAVKPGKYKTACSKGYGDYACANGEPDNLVLKFFGIDLFKPYSSDLFFYWNVKTKTFKKALITD